MTLDDVQVPAPTDPQDLLAAWCGQVRGLDSAPQVEADADGGLITQLRAIADDLARGPGPAAPLLPATTGQAEVLSEAIAYAETVPIANDTVITSPFADARQSVAGEVLAIHQTLAAELKGLREEFQKSHRRAARRSATAGHTVLGEATESPLLARLNDACTQIEALRAQAERQGAEFSQMLEEMRREFSATLSAMAECQVSPVRAPVQPKKPRADAAALQRAMGMLSVIDSLDAALQALRSERTPEARARIDHLERQVQAMAELVELQEIQTEGDVDEEHHEIVGVDAARGELGRIVGVRQRGYSFRGRVVRRARVVVGGASSDLISDTAVRAVAELTF